MPAAVTANVALLVTLSANATGCAVMVGATAGTSTRKLSTRPKLRLVLSESDENGSQYPIKMLLDVRVLVTEQIFSPSINHSITLPVLLTITSRQTKPTAPTAKPPVCPCTAGAV